MQFLKTVTLAALLASTTALPALNATNSTLNATTSPLLPMMLRSTLGGPKPVILPFTHSECTNGQWVPKAEELKRNQCVNLKDAKSEKAVYHAAELHIPKGSEIGTCDIMFHSEGDCSGEAALTTSGMNGHTLRLNTKCQSLPYLKSVKVEC